VYGRAVLAALVSLTLATIPAPTVRVVHEPCPDSDAVACTVRATATVYVTPGADRFAVQHELGHLFDAQRLDDGERAKLERLLALPGRPWRSGTGLEGLLSPSERFADAYAACRLRLDPDRNWMSAYDYEPSRRGFRKTCATIARAAD
jgi:hypothetical protein